MEWRALLARASAAVSLVLAFVVPVSAQRADLDDQLSLARVVVHEAGLLATEDEVVAIAAVLRSRCSRCRLSTAARAYSGRVFDATRTDPRAWVVTLDPRGIRPRHWPQGMDWNAYRANWLHVYELAGRAVRGEITHRCNAEVHHWGMAQPSSVDYQRAIRAGWTRVHCGDVRNAYWAVPARMAEDDS
jgi:hypothetical protein